MILKLYSRLGRRAVCAFAGLALFAGMVFNMAAQEPAADDQAASSADQPIRVKVDLVNIFFNVLAKKGGELIPNLSKDDFKIFEDGKEQKIGRFSRESDLPLTLGLLVDVSASQTRLIDIEREAAAQFFSSVVRPKDEAFLISFGKTTDLLQDFTDSPKVLQAALRDLRGDGIAPMLPGSMGGPTGPVGGSIGTPKGTLLFDAVYLASNEKLKTEVGRKALILITDGGDEGSTYNIREAIEAAQKSDAILYSIYYVDSSFYHQAGFMIGGGNEGDLKKMSEQTGGRVFRVDKKHPLDEIFKEIQEQLRNQYSISYTPSNRTRDGQFRRVEIKVDNSNYRVQAREGYYATPNDDQ